MTNRVGTGGTLARAYVFLFGHIIDVVGLSWLCAVFYGAAVFLLINRLAAALLIAPPTTPLVNQFTLPYFLGFLIATAFFGGAMAVALTRGALGQQESRAGVYFVYGAKELRMFFALLRVYAIALIVTLTTGYLTAKGATAISARLQPGQIWLNAPPNLWLTIAAAVITAGVFVFMQARLGFFLAPLAASGERALLRYSWQLSRGNSLATVTATLATLVSVFGILAAGYFSFSDSNFNATMIAQRGDPAMWHAFQANAGVIATICAVTLTALNALFAGASAYAYAIVEGGLERAEKNSSDYTGSYEAAYAMAVPQRVEPGFFAQEGPETFASAAETVPPVEQLSQSDDVAPPETIINESIEQLAEIEPLPIGEDIPQSDQKLPDEAAQITPPLSDSETPPASPEDALSEVV